MNKAIILVTILMMYTVLVSAQKKERRVDEEIRRLNAQEVAGLLNNNVRLLESLWADEFVVTNPLNKFVNKQDVLSLIQSGTLAFASYERRIDYVRVFRDFAVVAGGETVVWAGKMPNAGRASLLRFTGVWTRRNGHWQEVARHANIIIP
ncbi:MAG TPA: nuclear transport factor 2 family protein [Pyrinomonadaceae bacterium]|jgi:hypothetical protein|nr:nuclear transport factor 2 family protein [Pyrinomonadaceae bacterium]